MRCVATIAILLLFAPTARAQWFIDAPTTINSPVSGSVFVGFINTGVFTVNVVAGASVTHPNTFRTYNNSRIEMSGGTIANFWMEDTSRLTFSGGTVSRLLRTYEDSFALLTGGTVLDILAYDNSRLVVDGATVSGGVVLADVAEIQVNAGNITAMQTDAGSRATLSGGSVASLFASSSSNLLLGGGAVGTLVTAANSRTEFLSGSVDDLSLQAYSVVAMSGGNIGSPVRAFDLSTLRLFGTGIQALNPTSGTDQSGAYTQYELTGVLQSSGPLTALVRLYGDHVIAPEAGGLLIQMGYTTIPEPVSFGLILVGTGLPLARRRKSSGGNEYS